MLRLNQLTLARAGRVLIQGAQITLFPGEHAGLVGENGTGKSTLLAALRGELLPEKGDIECPPGWRLAHVSQETPALATPAIDFVLQGDTELNALQEKIALCESEGHFEELGELHARMADIDGYSARARAAILLTGLGFSQDSFEKPVAEFSGGWRVRLNLARALGSRAELMLLDEPTNHLDIEAVLWLEQWLASCKSTLIIVSHDREFLDAVCSHTVHLSELTLTKYTGGYTQFERQRAEHMRQQSIAAQKQSQEVERLNAFINRFKAKATKAKQAQSRMKRLDKLKEIVVFRPPHSVDFSFLPPDRMPDPLISLVKTACGYGESAVILKQVTMEIRPGDRWGLLGQNGNGKSTLIKTLVGELNILEGERTQGKGTTVGYFAQHQIDTLVGSDSALAHMKRLAPTEREQTLRDFLGRFGFPGERVDQPVETFSGGEKSRLAFGMVIWKKPNLLLLDEPTNHLDLVSREALAQALIEFEGALVVVSHDRQLLESCTDRFLRVNGGQVKEFEGDLDEYSSQLACERSEQKSQERAQARIEAAPPPVSKPKIATGPLQKQQKALEKAIAQSEERMRVIDHALSAADAFTAAHLEKSTALTKERDALAQQLAQLEEDWLRVQMELEGA